MAKAALKNCPICDKLPADAHTPFCSARCANIDLGRWLGEGYRVPTNEAPQDAPMNEEE